jgi:hypothetical protein
MWKSILITLVTLSVVIAALSLAVVGLMKLLGTEHFLLVFPIMTLLILRVFDDQSLLVKTTLMLMRFGSGGLNCTLNLNILE